jgi:hypothetical protein
MSSKVLINFVTLLLLDWGGHDPGRLRRHRQVVVNRLLPVAYFVVRFSPITAFLHLLRHFIPVESFHIKCFIHHVFSLLKLFLILRFALDLDKAYVLDIIHAIYCTFDSQVIMLSYLVIVTGFTHICLHILDNFDSCLAESSALRARDWAAEKFVA